MRGRRGSGERDYGTARPGRDCGYSRECSAHGRRHASRPCRDGRRAAGLAIAMIGGVCQAAPAVAGSPTRNTRRQAGTTSKQLGPQNYDRHTKRGPPKKNMWLRPLKKILEAKSQRMTSCLPMTAWTKQIQRERFRNGSEMLSRWLLCAYFRGFGFQRRHDALPTY